MLLPRPDDVPVINQVLLMGRSFVDIYDIAKPDWLCKCSNVGWFREEISPVARPTLNELAAFAAVAEHRNFRKAADATGVSRSALSHTLLGWNKTSAFGCSTGQREAFLLQRLARNCSQASGRC